MNITLTRAVALIVAAAAAIFQAAAIDLAATSISAPDKVAAGDSFEVTVTVANVGEDEPEEFFVELFADGFMVAASELRDIPPGEEWEVKFMQTMPATAKGPVSYNARVLCVGDHETENDFTSTIEVYPVVSEAPAPKNLMAKCVGEQVSLTWQEPELPAITDIYILKGYNVYRDGVKLNDFPVEIRRYSDQPPLPDEVYVYEVTAVYPEGIESAPSNEVSIRYEPCGIDEIGYREPKLRVEANRIIIEGAEGCRVTIVTEQGELICDITAGEYEEIEGPSGIAILRIEGDKAALIRRSSSSPAKDYDKVFCQKIWLRR